MGRYTLRMLRILIHNKYLLYRSIDHLVQSERFEAFYKENSNVSIDLINGQTRHVKKRLELFYDNDLSYSKLRYSASSLKIVNYSRMSKSQLEKAIDKKRTELSNQSKTK